VKNNNTDKKQFGFWHVFGILVLLFLIFKVGIPKYVKANFIKNLRPSQYVINSQNAEDEFRKGLNTLIKSKNDDFSYNSTKDFVKDLYRHMEMRMICYDNFENCFGYNSFVYEGSKRKNISSLKNPADIGLGNNFLETVAFLTKSGKPFLVSYKKDCVLGYKEEEAIPSCIAGIYDSNRAEKPNKFGTGINSKNDTISDIKGFNGARIGKCAVNINGLCIVATTFYPTPVSCQDVKNEFGIKTCEFNANDDYWAGAMKQCKDIGGHLTTPEELAKIASALFGRNISSKAKVDSRIDKNVKFNKNVANALGFNFVYYVPSMWSSEEKDGKTAFIRSIKPNRSLWSDDERNQSYQTGAMCIKN